MDVKLQNAYVEVLLENFMAVIKQNIMFQAQLEVFKSIHQENEDLKIKNNELLETNSNLGKKLDVISGENNVLKGHATQSETLKERDRLQVAVNDYMKVNHTLQNENNDLLEKINTLNKYIESLEQTIAPSKLKKIKSIDDVDVKNGGTF